MKDCDNGNWVKPTNKRMNEWKNKWTIKQKTVLQIK